MALLDGYDDDDLDPQVVEAIKKIKIKRDEAAHALGTIEAQYLHPLDSKTPEVAAQAAAVRTQFGL